MEIHRFYTDIHVKAHRFPRDLYTSIRHIVLDVRCNVCFLHSQSLSSLFTVILRQARRYIAESMGHRYAEGVILDMDAMCTENDKRTPMICFLSMGSDPTENIERLAKAKVYHHTIRSR